MPDLDPEVLESQEFKDAVASASEEATKAASESSASKLAELQTSIANLESNNKKLLGEKKDLDKEFGEFKDQYKDIDIAEYQARLEEMENDEAKALMIEGKFDEAFEKKLGKITSQHDAAMAQKDLEYKDLLDTANTGREDAETLAGTLRDTLVFTVRDKGISNAFVTADANKDQLRGVQAIAKDTVFFEGKREPVVSVDKDGQSVFRHSTKGTILQNADGNFDYPDWLNHLNDVEGINIFAKPTAHGDKNHRTEANPKGFTKRGMTDEQKSAFKKEFGFAEYNKLPLGERKGS